MLKFYIGTVIFYAIVILATLIITRSEIIKNGWTDGIEKSKIGMLFLLCVSAIPLFRLLFVIVAFYMFSTKKEDFEKHKSP